jgi:hypothetical protein
MSDPCAALEAAGTLLDVEIDIGAVALQHARIGIRNSIGPRRVHAVVAGVASGGAWASANPPLGWRTELRSRLGMVNTTGQCGTGASSVVSSHCVQIARRLGRTARAADVVAPAGRTLAPAIVWSSRRG